MWFLLRIYGHLLENSCFVMKSLLKKWLIWHFYKHKLINDLFFNAGQSSKFKIVLNNCHIPDCFLWNATKPFVSSVLRKHPPNSLTHHVYEHTQAQPSGPPQEEKRCVFSPAPAASLPMGLLRAAPGRVRSVSSSLCLPVLTAGNFPITTGHVNSWLNVCRPDIKGSSWPKADVWGSQLTVIVGSHCYSKKVALPAPQKHS